MINTSIKVQQLELRNRLVMPPMATAKADEHGYVTKDLCDYYAERAKGGCLGLIITEHCYISKEGKANTGQLSIADEGCIPGMKQLTDVIHQNGTPVFAQLSHAGGAAKTEITKMEALSVSSVKMPRKSMEILPKAMNEDDIKKVVQDFQDGARRAKKAGYDGVEIHSAHGYLLNQFYSPLTNKRTDKYTGATIEGRIRLLLEIIAGIRAELGASYPIAVRLGACDYMEGGTQIEDSIKVAEYLEQATVNLLDISGGFNGFSVPGKEGTQGYFQDLTAVVKEHVSIPVLLTGGITDAMEAERLIVTKKADLVGIGRALIKDASWARKALEILKTTSIGY